MRVLARLPRLLAASSIIMRFAVCLSNAASPSSPSLKSLLVANRERIASLRDIALSISNDESVSPSNDVFYLRYALDDSKKNDDERARAMRASIEWRSSEVGGRSIVTSARRAVIDASSSPDGRWNNDPVRDAAPHSEYVSKYFDTEQCITTTLPTTGDLVYCIRAGKIDDVGLMSSISIDRLVEYFLYCKEVNSVVADMRSLENDRLVRLITCNDLMDVKLVGGSPDLRKALSAASKKANELYPTFNGRTLMLNPPALLGVLARLFTPLFPMAVRRRLKFVSGPLRDVVDLREISAGGIGREEFVAQVDALAYD
ncbi:hypothetical protein ACHAXA_005610 [Cyclostephanos tholiformis]|uniref:CRAL-TRIO domain-containing protein n=1 Tax=Cyclostephanos tholiformis TaxID=382380 RepID=A0ABD3SGF1_9STRA